MFLELFVTLLLLAQYVEDENSSYELYQSATIPSSPIIKKPCIDSYQCWEDYYIDLASSSGSLTALADLKDSSEQDVFLKQNCHALLHRIGFYAAFDYITLAEALSHADTFCLSGMYHGILEGFMVRDGSDLVARLTDVCAEIPGRERYAFDYYMCVHGLGHGLMAYFEQDLFDSLAACETLEGTWEQHSCAGGVFMQNIMGNNDLPSLYLKEDDVLYPCNDVDEKFKHACFGMQTSYILTRFDNDYAHTFAICSVVEEPYRTICYESIGRDVSGYTGSNAIEAHRLCSKSETDEGREHCILGAAFNFVMNDSATENAITLCEREPKPFATECRRRMNEYLSSF